MPRKPVKRPVGRPPTPVKPISKGLPAKEIILDQVLYWIGLQATAEEIASSFYVSVDALNLCLKQNLDCNFAELKEKVGGSGKLTLRRHQFKQSEKNATMAIWLGKQWLSQKDHEEANKDSPKSEDIELKNKLYAALYEIQELKKELDDLKPKASQELQRSDSCDQPMDRLSQ